MNEGDLSRTAWRKSSYSNGNGGECVEVANLSTIVVRDSKNPDGPTLVFTVDEWREFVGGVRQD